MAGAGTTHRDTRRPRSRVWSRAASAVPLIPSFPSKTFPNHYTIVTGLYPGHHGIVGNSVKDPATGRRMTMSNRTEVQDPMWWGGEPIWVTIQRAGQPAAPVFWPGSEAPIGGQLPRFWEPFDEKVPATTRVDRVLERLDLPAAERPTFLTLYFSDVDGAGHDKGPESSGRRKRRPAGRSIPRPADSWSCHAPAAGPRQHRGRFGPRNGESNSSRVVVLDDYLSLDGIDIIDLNPTLGMFPPAGREETVYRALAGAHPRLKVFRKAESPAHWHYRDHPRIPPIVGVADEGWQILRRSVLATQVARGGSGPVGVHGYDPIEATSMRGIFVATGPAFKSGVTVPAFENVHIYNALSEVLGVSPAANDGDPKVARSLLR